MAIQRKKKVCKSCNREWYIVGKGLCQSCYYKLYRKKLKYRQEKLNIDKHGFKGEKSMYMEIWKEREHESFLSGIPLMGPEQPAWVSQFAHILPKAKYPTIQYDKRFVVMLTMDEHYAFDNLSEDQRRRFHPTADWDKLYELRENLKSLL